MKKETEKTKIAAKTLKRVSNMKAPAVKKEPNIPTEVLTMAEDLERYPGIAYDIDEQIAEKKKIDEYNAKNPNKKQKKFNDSVLKSYSEYNEYLYKGLPKKIVKQQRDRDIAYDPIYQETMPDKFRTQDYSGYVPADFDRYSKKAYKIVKKLKKKDAK